MAAAEEERFTGIKHDPSLPVNALRFCLDKGKISICDIDAIAFFEDPVKKLGRQIWMQLNHPDRLFNQKMDPGRPSREIKNILGYEGKILFYDHHMSHAASAFYFSGFPEAAVLTVDGVGEWATTSFGKCSDTEIDLFKTVDFPHSIGLLYSTLTSFLGFSINDAEYKVMGLAPYGNLQYLPLLRKLIDIDVRGGFRLNLKYFDFITGKRMFTDELIELLGVDPRKPESVISKVHQDIASSLQVLLEEVLLELCSQLYAEVPSRNLCMAGGVALNCVANGKIRKNSSFRNFFVQPAASDAGGALGAAAMAQVELTGKRPTDGVMRSVQLGPHFDSNEVTRFIVESEITAENFVGQQRAMIDQVVQLLIDQKVLGWYQGSIEFGPRALGSRSIIADPRNPGMRDKINASVKKRESFRPFAPSVLYEESKDHFELDQPSPFMLETCQVRSKIHLPAITHVDGSARVQTVHSDICPLYYELIESFFEKSGCPIHLNTSFNLRGEPIVLTPFDAFWCFVRSDLDYLVMGEYIIGRDQIPESWERMRTEWNDKNGRLRDSNSEVSHLTYTFF